MILSARGPAPPLLADESQMLALFASADRCDRHEGLLLAALAACPSHQGPKFGKVDVSSFSSAEFPIEMKGTFFLPQQDSEVVIVFTFDNGIDNGVVVQGGTVLFAVVSTKFISLSLVQLDPEKPSKMSEEDGFESEAIHKSYGGLRAHVQDLTSQHIALSPCAATPVVMKLGLSGSRAPNGMHVKLAIDNIDVMLDANVSGQFLQVLPCARDLRYCLQGGMSVYCAFGNAGTSRTRTNPRLDLQVVQTSMCETSCDPHTSSHISDGYANPPRNVGLQDDEFFWQLPVTNTLAAASLVSVKSVVSDGGSPKTIVPSSQQIYAAQCEKSIGSRGGTLLTNGTLLTRSSVVSRRDGSLTLSNSEPSVADSPKTRSMTCVDSRQKGRLSSISSKTSFEDLQFGNANSLFFVGTGACSYNTWPPAKETTCAPDTEAMTLPPPGALM